MPNKIQKFQWGGVKAPPTIDYMKWFEQSVFPKKSITSVLPYNTIKPLGTKLQGTTFDTKHLEVDKLLPKVSGSDALLSGKGINIATSGLDAVNSLLPSANEDSTTNTINVGYSALSDVAMAIPGYGQLIGGAMKAKSAMNKGLAAITGGASTIKNPTTTADKILSSDLFGASPIGLLNAFTKSKISGTDNELAKQAQSYGSVNTTDKTEVGGVSKAFSWLTGSKNKAKQKQALTDKYNAENIKKADVVNQSKKELLAAQNTSQTILSKNNQKLIGGIGTNILSAKNGDKLLFSKIQKNVANKLQSGGAVNVIPSGALHRELNHLDGDHTKKGIPVIMEEEGGKITQQAEIEREEIIFNLDLTKKLEELLKKFEDGDEEAAIEAGKLLTYEILENTQDNVGLINKIE